MNNSRKPTGRAQAEGLEAWEELDEMERQRRDEPTRQLMLGGGVGSEGVLLERDPYPKLDKEFPGTYFGCKVRGWVVGLGPAIDEGSAWGS